MESLTAARQTAHEKELELVELRQHVELLFAERVRHDELVQKLEAQVQQALLRGEEAQLRAERLVSPDSNEAALVASGEAVSASAAKDARIAELESQLAEIEKR